MKNEKWRIQLSRVKNVNNWIIINHDPTAIQFITSWGIYFWRNCCYADNSTYSYRIFCFLSYWNMLVSNTGMLHKAMYNSCRHIWKLNLNNFRFWNYGGNIFLHSTYLITGKSLLTRYSPFTMFWNVTVYRMRCFL